MFPNQQSFTMPLQFLLRHSDIVLTEIKLLAVTLAILYVSSHASLRRPPSAAPARKKKKKKKTRPSLVVDGGGDGGEESEYEDGEERQQPPMEGLQLSDAILFPAMAAVVLVGLYYLIQYLQDPDILNTVLQWYISVASLAGLVTLYSHAMQLAISAVFPAYWRSGATVYRVCQKTRRHLVWSKNGNRPADDHVAADTSLGPLPSASSAIRLPALAEAMLWEWRGLLAGQWDLELRIGGMVDEKTSVRLHHGVAVLLGVATVASYHVWKSVGLANLIGLSFCYASAQYLSPTSFAVGYSVLGGLFVYDIVMVFYTPYMITVATTIDAPMKLIIETGAKINILGLGDIAIPALLVGLALRFDLWMHYQKQAEYIPEVSEPQDGDLSAPDVTQELFAVSESRYISRRVPYVDVTGRWGDWLHTASLTPWASTADLPADVAAASFPKPYFFAAMGGYALGMVVTLSVALVFKHGQPALLYLVPAVAGTLCLTAVARGEVRAKMLYTEDGSIDARCSVVELDDRGELIKFFAAEEGKKVEEEKEVKDGGEKLKGGMGGKGAAEGETGGLPDVFLLRISAMHGTGVDGGEEAVGGKVHEE